MPPSREPKGRTVLLVGLSCVLLTAWTEGASPGSLAHLFWWAGVVVLALTAVSVTVFAVWVILVLAFSDPRHNDDAYEADAVRRERDR